MSGWRLPRNLGGYDTMNNRPFSSQFKGVVKLSGVLAILVLLFLVGVWLTPAPTPVYALQAPTATSAFTTNVSTGVKGVVAAYAALFPQILHINLPLVMH
jgi:hypothetical protein